jgi:hypothetical protein
MQNHFIKDKESLIKEGVDKLVYSTKEKEADNFFLIKTVANAVASQSRPEKDIKRNVENMNIHMGRWMDIKSDGQVVIKLKDGQTIKYGRSTIKNSPYIDIVTQSIAKDFNDKPIKNVIRDQSKNALVTRKEKQNALVKAKFQELIVKPIVEAATKQVDAKYGNPLDLGNEAIQQRQSDIDNIVNNNISEDIKNMMDNLTLPTEELLIKIHQIAYDRNGMKYKFQEGVDYFITSGIEAYKKRFGHNEIYMDSISSVDLSYRLKNNSIFFEKGLHANHKRYLTPMEIIQEGYHVFKKKEWKEQVRI